MRDHLKQLSTGVAIYGAGDAAIQVVNLALLAVYVKGGFLTTVDYGALAVIGALEAFAKVISRAGLDGAFMRYFHELGDGFPRFASTIFWFLVALNALAFSAAWLVTDRVGRHWFDNREHVWALAVMLLNTALIALTFFAFHTMRLRREAATYSAFTFARSIGTLVLRIGLVIGLGWGVLGMYLADLALTLVLVPLLWPWMRPFVHRTFSWPDLRLALRFGLPRVPHGLAQQALEGGNKLLLGTYLPQHSLGVYQNAATLGTGVKFFTSAFETAWAPFYYATSREPDGRETLARVTTYAAAALTLVVAVTAAVADDLVAAMLTSEYGGAGPVVTVIAMGLACHGLYLLTSIGLNLSSRTEFYTVSTFAAAGVGLGSGLWLMPRYGALGAAAAFLLSYATLAGVAFFFAQRLYPIRYELGRLLRVLVAGLIAAVMTRAMVPDLPPIYGLLARGLATTGLFVALASAMGVLRGEERQYLASIVGQWRARGRSHTGEL